MAFTEWFPASCDTYEWNSGQGLGTQRGIGFAPEGGKEIEFTWGNTGPARTAGFHPKDDIPARTCAMRHIRYGSRGVWIAIWEPGFPCPVLTPDDRSAGETLVGYSVSWADGVVITNDTYTIKGYQHRHAVAPSGNWEWDDRSLFASVPYALRNAGVINAAPTAPFGWTTEYRVTSVTVSNFRLGVYGWQAFSGAEVSLFRLPDRSDAEIDVLPWWALPSGSHERLTSVTALGSGSVSIIGNTPAFYSADGGFSYTWTTPTPGSRLCFLVNSNDVENVIDPFYDVAGGTNANRLMDVKVHMDVTYTAEYRYVFPTLPPLRQRQRDDGLSSSSVPRSSSQMTSRQASTRQRAYW